MEEQRNEWKDCPYCDRWGITDCPVCGGNLVYRESDGFSSEEIEEIRKKERDNESLVWED